jgi:hypothetical protein
VEPIGHAGAVRRRLAGATVLCTALPHTMPHTMPHAMPPAMPDTFAAEGQARLEAFDDSAAERQVFFAG